MMVDRGCTGENMLRSMATFSGIEKVISLQYPFPWNLPAPTSITLLFTAAPGSKS
jgi:hypothetical protein